MQCFFKEISEWIFLYYLSSLLVIHVYMNIFVNFFICNEIYKSAKRVGSVD